MKKYLTQFVDDAGRIWSGPTVNAICLEHAEIALEVLIDHHMVKPGTEIIGEMEERTVTDDVKWTCHICGELRPDAVISVLTKPLGIPGVQAEQNIRYCNDKPECRHGAETFSFFEETIDDRNEN